MPPVWLDSRQAADGHHHNWRLLTGHSLSQLAWIPSGCGTQSHCLAKWVFWDELLGWHAALVFSPATGRLVWLNVPSSTSWPGFWKLLTVCFYLCLLVSLGSFILCCNNFFLSSSHGPWTLGHCEFKDKTSCFWETASCVTVWNGPEMGLCWPDRPWLLNYTVACH